LTCRPIIFGAIGFADTGALGGRAGDLVDLLWEVGLDRSVVLRLGRLKRQVLDSQLGVWCQKSIMVRPPGATTFNVFSPTELPIASNFTSKSLSWMFCSR
jgi:hypothetical protein